jgi:hypothetical protein
MLAASEKGINSVIQKNLGYVTDEFRIDVPRNMWACSIVYWNLEVECHTQHFACTYFCAPFILVDITMEIPTQSLYRTGGISGRARSCSFLF